MNDLSLLIDLHLKGQRQGPGGDEQTRLAVKLSGLEQKSDLKIADIGCGTGASTLVLAELLEASITAVDLLPEFLGCLNNTIANTALESRITTLEASMDSLPFDEHSLDAIWSEGAIYNMGFTAGVKAWRPFLKPGGILAVSELTWLTASRPAELDQHWQQEYPEVDTAAGKIAVLEANGFSPVGYFPLPQRCWLENYYRPMQARFAEFLDRHSHTDAAKAIVEAERAEISLYERYSSYVSYGYYIAEKVGE
ncbi:MAG: methyltransferase domain-containing protein [Halieaceae bacterium]|jgi:ubiquinone/menaquinone biosynthesis C-methylase UbiE|nr:methyltransferase domain-containing protein [Halieaceae bacterium]